MILVKYRNGDMMDSRRLKAGQEFSGLQDSYMVFITQTDIFGHGIPIYTINRHFEEIDESFDDGSHIVYVNGNYKGDDTVGRLMHDFGCKEAKDMYYPELAKGIRHFKEEGGRWMSGGHPLARTGVERRPREDV